ncbi:MAG TPA: FxLYD domain-containing protein [Anaerolineales bacterium]|nr:FxLYD domain-containing protein [Anaerolineales bacterium]
MKSSRSIRFLSTILVLAGGMLACNLSAAEPTAVPTPTEVPPIPTNAPAPTATAEPTTPPLAPTQGGSDGTPLLEILQVNGYLDSFDSWNIVGLVQNNSDRIVDSIEIEIELFDTSGNSIYVNTTFVDLFNIAPGEITPFSYTVFEDLPDADNFVATVIGNSTTTLERANPEVVGTNMVHDDNGDTHITGELVNNTDQPIQISSLAAATFDATGQVLSANSYSVSIRYLNPGDTGPFRISITGADSGTAAIDSFVVYTDAEFTQTLGPFGLTISNAYDYVDTFDGLHLVGEVTNDGSLALNVNLVAAIYAADGTVLDASEISLPINVLPPGESLPYDFDFWGPLNNTAGLLAQADSYVIQVDAYWTWETTTELFTLSKQNEVNEFDEFGGEFNGQVVNDSGGPVDYITIVIFLRDLATGQVVASGYDFIFDEVPDGGTADYTVFIDVPEGFDVNSAEYFTIVTGERP